MGLEAGREWLRREASQIGQLLHAVGGVDRPAVLGEVGVERVRPGAADGLPGLVVEDRPAPAGGA